MSFDEAIKQSFFDMLRPSVAQNVTHAIVTTYSLDLTAMLGLVLALGGQGEQEFDAGPLGLVDAFDRVRGKLTVLHQISRIPAPRRHRNILLMLDRMLMAMPADERLGSWHPKVALVRYGDGDGPEWRFWIGSRNLTGSTDLDAGLLLSGRPGKKKSNLEIAGLAADLFTAAPLPSDILDELGRVRWVAPEGVSVTDIQWRRQGSEKPFVLRQNGKVIVAASPFVDVGGLTAMRGLGNTAMTLVTTDQGAAACVGQTGLDLRVRARATPHVPVADSEPATVDAEFSEPPYPGLHAKLFMTRGRSKAQLMIGSANLTMRGLIGPNAEAVAIVSLSESLATTFDGFVGSHSKFVFPPIDKDAEELERAKRRFDSRVSALLSHEFVLVKSNDGLAIETEADLRPDQTDVRFFAELFSPPSNLIEWPVDAKRVVLSMRPLEAHEETTFVIFTATDRKDDRLSRSWTQSLPMVGFDADRRDRMALARYIGASRLRPWLRGLMEGVVGAETERWSDGGPNGMPATLLNNWISDSFALESMLGRWVRNPDEFEARVVRMTEQVLAFKESFESLPDGEERVEALAEINELSPFLDSLAKSITGTFS